MFDNIVLNVHEQFSNKPLAHLDVSRCCITLLYSKAIHASFVLRDFLYAIWIWSKFRVAHMSTISFWSNTRRSSILLRSRRLSFRTDGLGLLRTGTTSNLCHRSKCVSELVGAGFQNLCWYWVESFRFFRYTPPLSSIDISNSEEVWNIHSCVVMRK